MVVLVKTSAGWYPTEEEPEGYIADDGWFVVLGAGTGVLVAVVAWLLLRRNRGPLVLIALAAGSFAGATLAQWLGHRLGLAEYERLVRSAVSGTTVHRPVKLRSEGAKLVQVAVAVAGYTLLAAFHHAPSLRNDDPEFTDDGSEGAQDDGEPGVSSEPGVSTVPSAAPEPPAPVRTASSPDGAGSVPPGAG
jgi:hypothetical protein